MAGWGQDMPRGLFSIKLFSEETVYSAFSIKLFSEDYDTRIVTILRLQTLLINIGGQVG